MIRRGGISAPSLLYNRYKRREKPVGFSLLVRLIGLEPTRIATPDPKSGASTNFATSAKAAQR